jgi:hypothetical protein
MKQTLIVLCCLFQILDFIYGQSSDSSKTKASKEFAMELSPIQTSLLSKKFYGINWSFTYFPGKRIGTGAYIIFASKKISDTFTYSIKKPIIQFYEIGWTNQYNFIQTNRVRMNISLVNGFSQVRLGDNAIKEKQHKYAPKEIASNYFYTLEPGSSFSYKIISNNHNADFWLTAFANYRFVFGNTKYGMTKEFSGYLFGLGISIIGVNDDKAYPKK